MLITSCSVSTREKADPVVVDTACNWVKRIYVTENDVKVMDRQTKRDILTHNQKVDAICSPDGHAGQAQASAQ